MTTDKLSSTSDCISPLAPLLGIAGEAEVHRELLLDLHFMLMVLSLWYKGRVWLLEFSNTLRRNHLLEKERAISLPAAIFLPNATYNYFLLTTEESCGVLVCKYFSGKEVQVSLCPLHLHQTTSQNLVEKLNMVNMRQRKILNWAKLCCVWIVGAPAMTVRWNNYVRLLENILYWKVFKCRSVIHQKHICASNVDFSNVPNLAVWCIEKTCVCALSCQKYLL